MGFLRQAFEKRDVTVVGDELWRHLNASTIAGVAVTPEKALTFSAVFAAHKILAESTAMLPLFLLKR
jgi:phage portal protein BeeE